jgi:hypothetical protein
MWSISFAVAIAILIDYLIYIANTPDGETKIYYPNLRIWGLGLVSGVGMVVISLFGQAIDKLASCPPPPGSNWLVLAPLFSLTAAVALLIWAVVVLCRSE